MIFLLHTDQETAQLQIDGRHFEIPPDVAFEVSELRGNDRNNNGSYEYIIPDHLVAAKLREHGWYHGLVQVPVRRNGNDITVDVASARLEARDALQKAQDALLELYVRDQQERVKEGKAALPPGGRVAVIIERRGIDLKQEFNIDPPGWKLEKLGNRDREIAELQAQVAALMARQTTPLEVEVELEPESTGKRKR